MSKTTILYNGNSLVCSYEMGTYCKYARKLGLDMTFQDLHTTDLTQWGLTKEKAMRNLHVMHHGQVLSGVDAFMILWQKMPRYQVWGKFVNLPGMHELSSAFFDWVAMPILYRINKSRTHKIGLETFTH
jgi:predicted DCC family thiol-disulfide oxidoreductase YuxK